VLASAAWFPLFAYLRRHPDLLVDLAEAPHFGAQRLRPLIGVVSFALAPLVGYLVNRRVAIADFV
jgi:hypothetical protein